MSLTVTVYSHRDSIENDLRSLAAIESELPMMESWLQDDPVYFKAKYVSRRVSFHSEYHHLNYSVSVNIPWQVYLMVVKLNGM